MRSRSVVAAALVIGISVPACGQGAATVDELTVAGAWARPTPAGATNGVVYLEITSPVDDTLRGVTVPTAIAGSAMVHESSGDGGGSGHEGHTGGASGDMVGMTEQSAVPLAAGEPVAFRPGGLHVMLTDLAAPLHEGDSFDVTLTFDTAGDVAVPVVVAVNPP